MSESAVSLHCSELTEKKGKKLHDSLVSSASKKGGVLVPL